MNVSAIVVTRGNVDLRPILDSLPEEWEVLAWNNGLGLLGTWRTGEQIDDIEVTDLSVYGRYAAIEYASHDLIYVQDDDVIVSDPQAIVDEWWRVHGGPEWRRLQGGTRHLKEHLVANMPQEFRPHYTDSCLVGFGAAFHRDLPGRAFERFQKHYEPHRARNGMTQYLPGDTFIEQGFWWRTCDVVFTTLSPRVLVDVAKTDLPYASDPNRMWKQPNHVAERTRMLDLVRQVPDGT